MHVHGKNSNLIEFWRWICTCYFWGFFTYGPLPPTLPPFWRVGGRQDGRKGGIKGWKEGREQKGGKEAGWEGGCEGGRYGRERGEGGGVGRRGGEETRKRFESASVNSTSIDPRRFYHESTSILPRIDVEFMSNMCQYYIYLTLNQRRFGCWGQQHKGA